MSNKSIPIVATMGIDIGKNSLHVVGLDVVGLAALTGRANSARQRHRSASPARA